VIVGTVWLFALSALTGCASLHPTGDRARVASYDWPSVMRLERGSAVRVEDVAGADMVGTLVGVTSDGVTVSQRSGSQTVLRPSVQRISLRQRQTATKAWRGWLVGTIAGTVLGAIVPETNRLPWAVFMGVGWGAIGAGIGASDGYFDRRESLVYQAPPVEPAQGCEGLANMRVKPTAATTCGRIAAVGRRGLRADR
jgi:hypothetical protein